MKCRQVHNSLLFYVENSTFVEEKKEIELHLEKCEACNMLFHKMKDTLNVIETEKLSKNNSFFYNSIMKKTENESTQKKEKMNFTKVINPLLAAAVVILGLFIGVLIGKNSHKQANSEFEETMFSEEIYFNSNELAYESVETYLMNNE